MDILQSIETCNKTVSSIRRWQRNSNPLLVENIRFGGIPPERIAVCTPIIPDLAATNEYDAISPSYYLASSEKAGWAGEDDASNVGVRAVFDARF